MAAPISAGKHTTRTKTTYWLVPSITEAGILATEINSVSGLNITGFLLGDQATPGMDTSKTDLPRNLLESSTTEVLDTQKVTIPTFRFLWNPQAAAGANDKKAWALLKDGFDGYLVRRQNFDATAEANTAAGEFVDWFKVESYSPMPTESASDASGLNVFDVDFAATRFALNEAVA